MHLGAYKCHAAAFIVGHSTTHDKFSLQDASQCISTYCATYDNLAHVQLLQSPHNHPSSLRTIQALLPGSTDQRERVPDIHDNVTCDMHMNSHLWQDVRRHVLHIRSFIGCYVGHRFSACT